LLVKKIGAVYEFEIKDETNKKSHFWNIDVKNNNGSVNVGPGTSVDCSFSVGDSDFQGLMEGKLNPQQLFMQGKLKVTI
jgi:putative sterol carrier protein